MTVIGHSAQESAASQFTSRVERERERHGENCWCTEQHNDVATSPTTGLGRAGQGQMMLWPLIHQLLAATTTTPHHTTPLTIAHLRRIRINCCDQTSFSFFFFWLVVVVVFRRLNQPSIDRYALDGTTITKKKKKNWRLVIQSASLFPVHLSTIFFRTRFYKRYRRQ